MTNNDGNQWKLLAIYSIAILVILSIGLIIVDDYGPSWDEPGDRVYADGVLSAYSNGEEIFWEQFGERRYYGPAYFSIWRSLSNSIAQVITTWDEYIAGHFINFFIYILGMCFFYGLARHFFKPFTSILITSLYFFQPVLFGHAFINPKDIPFMTAFLGVIASGTLFIRFTRYKFDWEESSNLAKNRLEMAKHDWSRSSVLNKMLFILILGLALISLGIILLGFLGTTETGDLVSKLIGLQENPLRNIGGRILTQVIKVEAALGAGSSGFRWVYIPLAISFFVLSIGIFIGMKIFSKFIREWFSTRRGINQANRPGLAAWLAIICCGIALGLAGSIRILGPLAGVLIIALLYLHFGYRSLSQISVIVLISILVSYATWPFLWENPIKHYIEAMTVASRHPWRGAVFFEGALLTAKSIPWYYIPKLLLIQLTEPLLILILIGLVRLLLSPKLSKSQILLGGVLVAWFAIPISIPILGNSIVYDNFRQFLFALPPLFILAGFGIESIFERVKYFSWKMAIVIIVLVPGLFAITQLHPYEYIYYNSLVGGVKRAQDFYETDYWCTSYREAAEIINLTLPTNSRVAVWGPSNLVEFYARADFEIITLPVTQETPQISADVVILCPRSQVSENLFPDSVLVDHVTRDGIGLTVIKELR